MDVSSEVVKRTDNPFWQAASPRPIATWVLLALMYLNAAFAIDPGSFPVINTGTYLEQPKML